jgi:hypothetical protein
MSHQSEYGASWPRTGVEEAHRSTGTAAPTATKERERLLRGLFKREEFLSHDNVEVEVEHAPRKPASLMAKCHPAAGLRARYYRSDRILVLLCRSCSTPLGSVIPLDGFSRRKADRAREKKRAHDRPLRVASTEVGSAPSPTSTPAGF